jgi:hypothetical protein
MTEQIATAIESLLKAIITIAFTKAVNTNDETKTRYDISYGRFYTP